MILIPRPDAVTKLVRWARRRRVPLAWTVGYLAWFAILMVAVTSAAATPVQWHRAGASTFGGPCEPSEHTGYRGDYLPTLRWAFAELKMGTALGSLPYRTTIRVLNPRTHRRHNIVKADIGGGGGNVFGLRRSLDLYWPVTHYLDPRASCSSWTGVVLWRFLQRPPHP